MNIQTFDNVWDAISETPIDKLVSMMAHAGLHITSIEISEPEAA